MSKTNTNTNIFGLIRKGKYQYEYIWGDKKGQIRIRIWIFRLIVANTNTNTNIRHTLYPYLPHNHIISISTTYPYPYLSHNYIHFHIYHLSIARMFLPQSLQQSPPLSLTISFSSLKRQFLPPRLCPVEYSRVTGLENIKGGRTRDTLLQFGPCVVTTMWLLHVAASWWLLQVVTTVWLCGFCM